MALSSEHSSLAGLQALLDSPDTAVRLVAVREVADACAPEFLPIATRALGDSVAEVRLEAVLALDAMGGVEAVVPLIRALHDADAEVRKEAAKALAELNDPGAIIDLLAALSKAIDPWIIAALFDALKPLRSADALPLALTALDHADAGVRAAAIGVVGYQQAPAAVPRLARLSAEDASAEVRHAALRALVYGPAKQVHDAAIHALRDAEWIIRATSAGILGKLQDAFAIAALMQLLAGETEWQVREQAIETLGLLQAHAAVPVIALALQAPVSNVRKAAVVALGRIGGSSLKQQLAVVRDDPDVQVRKLTAQLLERLETAT